MASINLKLLGKVSLHNAQIRNVSSLGYYCNCSSTPTKFKYMHILEIGYDFANQKMMFTGQVNTVQTILIDWYSE